MKMLDIFGLLFLQDRCSLFQALPYLINKSDSYIDSVISKVSHGIPLNEIQSFIYEPKYKERTKLKLIEKKVGTLSFNSKLREILLNRDVSILIREALAYKIEPLDEKYFDMVHDFLSIGYGQEKDFLEIRIGYMDPFRGIGGILLSNLTQDNFNWAKRIEKDILNGGVD